MTIISTEATNEAAMLVENVRIAFESAWKHFSVEIRE